MTRVLPKWIEFRRDTMARQWAFVCRACGVKERFHSFWLASEAAHDHAAMHLAEEDPPVTSAGASAGVSAGL